MSLPDDERYGPADSEAALGELRQLLGESFCLSPTEVSAWTERAGRPNVRCYLQRERVVGGLLLIPMGQFWGGRSVPTAGLAGVVIAPALRGTGMASRMLRAAMAELRARGFALCVGFPSTQPLYRRLGFEQAGTRFAFHAAVRSIHCGDRSLSLRPYTADDVPAVQALYTQTARGRPGWVDRGPYVWQRVMSPRGVLASGYVVVEDDAPVGYVFLSRRADAQQRQHLVVEDWAGRDQRAWRRLLGFVQDHGSVARQLTWYGGADDPLPLLWEELHEVDVLQTDAWLLRIVDLEAALTSRGYPAGLEVSLGLEVSDPSFEALEGRFVLQVRRGEGRLSPSDRPGLRCDLQTLAALYSGYRRACELARLGRLEGAPEALALAEAVFSSGTPSMADSF